MKRDLEDLPRNVAVDAWNDMSAWLKDFLCGPAGERPEQSLHLVDARFGLVLTLAKERAEHQKLIDDSANDAHKLSLILSSLLTRLDSLQRERDQAPAGSDHSKLDYNIEAAR